MPEIITIFSFSSPQEDLLKSNKFKYLTMNRDFFYPKAFIIKQKSHKHKELINLSERKRRRSAKKEGFLST
jgi:hypothetical protein